MAVALATTLVLGPEDFLFLEPQPAGAPALAGVMDEDSRFERLLLACERTCLEAVLAKSKTQKEAAEALGLTQTKMHRLLRKHGLIASNSHGAGPDS